MTSKNKNKDITFSEYLVCYIDFLGGRNLIDSEKNGEHLKNLKQIYEYTLENDFNIKNKKILKEIKFMIFSDNVVIASKINTKTPLQIRYTIINFFYIIALFQTYALEKGYLLRGGITLGSFYIDKTIVWGQALVRAYDLESKKAKFPRIILDDNVVSLIKNLYSKTDSINKIHMINDDKIISLDYLKIIYDSNFKKNLLKWKEKHVKEIKKYIKKSDEESIKILEKLDWHTDYFNNFCRNNNLDMYIIKETEG